MNAPLVMDEADLPEVLREALRAARERMADKQARRHARGGALTYDDDDDEEFEVWVPPLLRESLTRRPQSSGERHLRSAGVKSITARHACPATTAKSCRTS